MGSHRWFSLKQRAMLSCIIPICLGILLLFGTYIDPYSPLFIAFCFIFGGLAISTGALAMIGVATKLSTALEVTQPLLAVENSIAIVAGVLFMINLVFIKHFHLIQTTSAPLAETGESYTTTTAVPSLSHAKNFRMLSFLAPKGSLGERFILQYPWIGYTAALLLILFGLMGFITTELLGSYKTELNVDQAVRERRTLRRRPGPPLLPTTEEEDIGERIQVQDKDEEKALLKDQVVLHEDQTGTSDSIDREQKADIGEMGIS